MHSQPTQPPPGLPLPSQGEGKIIHVVAGVIRDALGQILLTRRTEGRDLAGLWEFPGGKVESGESPETALIRELHEELGIHARVGPAFIRVPQQYPDKRLVLDVHQIHAYTGTPRGLDGQALAWAPPHTLIDYPTPPADRPVVAALLQPEHYLVTPAPGDSDAAWLAALEYALTRGVRRVQLRAPGIGPARWAELVEHAVVLCRAAGAEVLINGDLAVAERLGAGVHLRSSQLRDADTGAALAPLKSAGCSIAGSCHDADDLLRAQELDCDFAVLGHVHPTPSHPGQPGIGWAAFAQMREQVSLPIYAIGGLSIDDLPMARQHGAQGIAAIRGLWS